MKVEASSIDEYFAKSGDRESMLRELDKLIQKNAPSLERKLFDGMSSVVMIGYGFLPYKFADGHDGEWPVIALANQKNYMSVYVCVVKDGKYIAEAYADDLGKVSVGKSCIRFNKIEKVNLDVLAKVIKETEKLHKENKNEFGRKDAKK